MNKKILIGSILAVLMLVAISFATTVSSNTTTNEKKETPLYKIRTKLAIGEQIKDMATKFLKTREFLLLQWLINKNEEDNYTTHRPDCTSNAGPGCLKTYLLCKWNGFGTSPLNNVDNQQGLVTYYPKDPRCDW